MITNSSKWSKVWVGVISYLIPLTSYLFIISSCGNNPSQEESARAEQLIKAAHKAKDYQRLISLADSLEAKGSMTPAQAYYWQGYASDRTNHRRMAEFYYNTALKAAGTDDPEILAKAASHLANLMAVRGDYENGLKIATPVVRQLEELQCDTTSDYVNLLIYIGCCQAGLGTSGEATADGFDKAYERHLDNVKKNRTDEAYKDAIAGLINIVYACNYIGQYREALKWNSHFSEMISEYEQRPGISSEYIDKQQARYNLYQAQALEGLDKDEEAAKAFDAFLTSQYAKTPEGRILANDYLIAAERWGEAADNYQSLDARDSLTNAFQRAKEIDAAEQAVIVRKVEELGEQQVAATRRHQLAVLGLIGLIFLAVIGYVFYRRYHHYQLHLAHRELRKDIGELETAATERSRTETEQRIAAAISQYVAHEQQLPQRDDLTLLVSQTPGTMAGSCFCGAVQQGDALIFAIGSATGKGVTAATTSAMTWAQFRTAASIDTNPEHIITAINEAISDGKHMPVRILVGSLDMTSGLLQYCNAGNNTPLLSDKELTLLPDCDGEPVGTQAGYAYTTHQTTLAKGKWLFLYANGVAEATDADGKPLGDKHLRGMALQAFKVNERPEPFLQNIQKAVDDYTGSIPQANDLTMMVIGRK